jgi:hypothetical protein
MKASFFGKCVAAGKGLGPLVFLIGASCSTQSVYEPEADREGVREVVAKHMNQAEECYLGAIEKRPGAEGKVLLQWDIGADGRAENVKIVEINPKLVDISDCLTQRLRSWKFPIPNGHEIVTIRYPLFFSENGKFQDIGPSK